MHRFKQKKNHLRYIISTRNNYRQNCCMVKNISNSILLLLLDDRITQKPIMSKTIIQQLTGCFAYLILTIVCSLVTLAYTRYMYTTYLCYCNKTLKKSFSTTNHLNKTKTKNRHKQIVDFVLTIL